jgi:hypothetical protein
VFWNVTNDVTQRILPQHLFSSSVGMTRQTPHTHQVGFPSGTRSNGQHHLCHILPNSWHNPDSLFYLTTNLKEYCLLERRLIPR